MAVRVIADFTMKEGWCEKIRAMLEDEENGLNLTIKQEGCIDIDMAIDVCLFLVFISSGALDKSPDKISLPG